MLGPPLPPSSSPRRRAAPTPATPGRAPDTTSARDRQEHAQHATRMHRQHGEPLRSSASPLFYFLLPPSHGRGGSPRRRHATAPQGGGRGTRRSSERHGAASSPSLLLPSCPSSAPRLVRLSLLLVCGAAARRRAALWGALHPTPHPADSTPPSETRNQRQHFRGTTVPGIFGGGESNGDHGEPQFALSADPVQQGEAFYSIFAFHSDLHHSPHHRRVQPTIR
jgi:hypothetical protein